MNPELSIIIPVYNVEKYIHQCIDSVLDQKKVDLEIIAVDDGSPDNCPSILDEYAINDKRIHVIHKQNGGVSNARNTGIEQARGKWVYFVDSDDWLVADSLAKAVEYGNKTDSDIVFVDCFEQYDNHTSKRLKLFSEEFVTSDRETILEVQKSILCHKYSPYYSQGADSAYPAPWSKLIRLQLIKDYEARFDPSVGGVYDDGLFTLEVLEHANRVSYSNICTYNYRILTSSIVHAYREGMVEKFEKNCFRIDEFVQKYRKDDSFQDAEYARRIAYLSSFLSSYFFSNNNPLPIDEKKKQLKCVIQRSPWKEAIKKAKISLLENKHKYTLICMRLKILEGLKFYSVLKKAKMKRLEK